MKATAYRQGGTHEPCSVIPCFPFSLIVEHGGERDGWGRI